MYDYIVIGSGIAGLLVALMAERQAGVLVLTKAGLNDSNTNDAQGGIAAAVGPDDWADLHWRDTMIAGAGLTDPLAAWVLAAEAPARIDDLLRFGVPFDREDGILALGLEGGHSRPRVLHAGGDATGAAIQLTLGRMAQEAAHITIREQHHVTAIVADDGVARGVQAIDRRSGQELSFAGRVIVLATGGAGQLYEHTTNPTVATGSGLALAYRAGASLADVEFCQFHPTVLCLPGAPCFLISEAARGEGGVLVNGEGRRFMGEYDQRGELASRDIVAGAILAEMAREGTPCVYLDLSHLPAAQIAGRFPSIMAFCRQYGLDITKRPIPVAPAAHYMMGGVRTDLWGETDVPGLFACGEVACTGVHGANRLASNSLLEALVFGARIVHLTTSPQLKDEIDDLPARLAGSLPPGIAASVVPEDHRFGPVPWSAERRPWQPGAKHMRPAGDEMIRAIQRLMWQHAGTSRSGASLRTTLEALREWEAALPAPASIGDYERRDLLLVAQLVVTAALAREETRGGHRRLDFANEDAAWRRRLVYRAEIRTEQAGTGCRADR